MKLISQKGPCCSFGFVASVLLANQGKRGDAVAAIEIKAPTKQGKIEMVFLERILQAGLKGMDSLKTSETCFGTLKRADNTSESSFVHTFLTFVSKNGKNQPSVEKS